MTSSILRKLLVAGACVAALGVVACKPKPAAETTAASDAAAAASDASAAASAAASDAAAAASSASDAAAAASDAAPASQ
jgi:hypothetical protein